MPAGRFQTEDFDQMADIADKYSGGEMRITCEENILFPNVKNEDIEAMRAEPLFSKFLIDAGNVMRGLVSCTGSQFCGFALIETKNRCRSHLAPLSVHQKPPATNGSHRRPTPAGLLVPTCMCARRMPRRR